MNISGFTVSGATATYYEAGIYLNNANHCNISDNNASNNYGGISLWSSNNTTLQNNIMSGNTYNLCVCGNSLSDYTHSIDISNMVDGKPVYYWVDQQDRQIPEDAGFVGVVNSKNITVRDLTLTKNHEGVLFAYTDNSRIENNTANSNDNYGICLYHSSNNTLFNNTANSNDRGIHLRDSNNNTLRGNTASNNIVLDDRDYTGSGIQLMRSNNNTLQGNIMNLNSEVGIYLWCHSSNNTLIDNTISNSNYFGIHLDSSSNNTLIDNTISNSNYFGIFLDLSSNNTLYHNNLINNTLCNAYDTGTNQWDSCSKGNYWSDYREKYPGAVEIDDSGIWNTPYDIPDCNNTDRYPLMHPWTAASQKGDLNRDNRITPADAAIALTIAAGGDSASCDPTTLAAADVSGDNRITSLDALMILQAAAGAIEL